MSRLSTWGRGGLPIKNQESFTPELLGPNCCMTKFFVGRYNPYIRSPQIGSSLQTKLQAPPKFNLVSQWILLGIQKYGWGITYRRQRQLPHQGIPWHGWQLTELGTWSSLHSSQAAQQVGECPQLFQASCLVFASSRWLLSESPLQFAFGRIWSVSGTSWGKFYLFTCLFKEPPVGRNVSILEQLL